jgi:subtilisin family serine protease
MSQITDQKKQSTNEHNTYYYANGKRIPIQRDPDIFAVSYRPGRDSRDSGMSRNAFKLLHEEARNVGFIPDYGLQIYRSAGRSSKNREEAGQRTVRMINALENLEKEASVDYAALAYRRQGEEVPDEMDDLMFVSRNFLVQFRPGISKEQILELNQKHQVSVIKKLDYTENGYLLKAPRAEGESGPLSLSNLYYESGMVGFAHPSFIRRRFLRDDELLHEPASHAPQKKQADERDITGIQFLSRQWHLHTAKVVDAWSISKGSEEIKVAIVDDGIDTAHPEFGGKIHAQYDASSGSNNGRPKFYYDNHGTACAGVAVAAGYHASGVAPLCELLAIRYPDYLDYAQEAEMFYQTALRGADIISCSWGPKDGTGALDPLPDNVRAAISYCVHKGRKGKGIPVFWASGNGNESLSRDGYASNPDVMAVGASTSKERRSWYSDYGPELFICAPSSGSSESGEFRIFTTDRVGNDGYNPDPEDGPMQNIPLAYTSEFGGTSSSTPLVAGVAGLMLAVNPDLSLAEIRQILKDTADKIDPHAGAYDSNGHSIYYGYGRVNALKAVKKAEKMKSGIQPAKQDEPAISTSAETQRHGPPPVFDISKGGRRLYAVEMATQARLFNNQAHGHERQTHNFYASWQDSMLEQVPFTLPDDVWQRLQHAGALYYRLHVADDAQWENYAVTTPDKEAHSAPMIRVLAGHTDDPSPDTSSISISGPADLSRYGPPPVFDISKGGRRLYAVEVATQARLFNNQAHGHERQTHNFYASWQDSMLEQVPFTLPDDVWQQLKAAEVLYYRLHVADDSQWSNYGVSLSDQQALSAPGIQLSGQAQPSQSSEKRHIIFPSGSSFHEVDAPLGSIDYSDPVAQEAVPLIEVRGRQDEYLSSNFKVKEFTASDGAPYARISVKLVEGLQRIRTRLGTPLHINSAYRHSQLNAAVGGVADSQHMTGRAADIRAPGHTPLQVARLALEELGFKIGIGLGFRYVHVDLRGYLASWTYEGAEMDEHHFDRWIQDFTGRNNKSHGARLEYALRVKPSIVGPERHPAAANPPIFRIQTTFSGYYGVEIAAQPELFAPENKLIRSPDNYYASAEAEGMHAVTGTTLYMLPKNAWEMLREKQRLYYRLTTSGSPDVSQDTMEASVEREALHDAPWILIDGQQAKRASFPELPNRTKAEEALWRG